VKKPSLPSIRTKGQPAPAPAGAQPDSDDGDQLYDEALNPPPAPQPTIPDRKATVKSRAPPPAPRPKGPEVDSDPDDQLYDEGGSTPQPPKSRAPPPVPTSKGGEVDSDPDDLYDEGASNPQPKIPNRKPGMMLPSQPKGQNKDAAVESDDDAVYADGTTVKTDSEDDGTYADTVGQPKSDDDDIYAEAEDSKGVPGAPSVPAGAKISAVPDSDDDAIYAETNDFNAAGECHGQADHVKK
jgi:hypothetical protein